MRAHNYLWIYLVEKRTAHNFFLLFSFSLFYIEKSGILLCDKYGKVRRIVSNPEDSQRNT